MKFIESTIGLEPIGGTVRTPCWNSLDIAKENATSPDLVTKTLEPIFVRAEGPSEKARFNFSKSRNFSEENFLQYCSN